MTVWCLWWRVFAGRASPTRMRWKKTGKITSQTRAKEELQETIDAAGSRSKIAVIHELLLGPFYRHGVACSTRHDRSHRSNLVSDWPLRFLPREGKLDRAPPPIDQIDRGAQPSGRCLLAAEQGAPNRPPARCLPGPGAVTALGSAGPACSRSELPRRAMAHAAGPLAGPCSPRLLFFLLFFLPFLLQFCLDRAAK
jgi:hypothetical protein